MGRLDGKIAAITGADSGIGLASAKRFVAALGPRLGQGPKLRQEVP